VSYSEGYQETAPGILAVRKALAEWV